MKREQQMINDLIEIMSEEYEKRLLITPQNTAEKLTEKGYRLSTDVAREIFDQIQAEITAALDSNYKARILRLGDYDYGKYELFIECVDGKISALRGIDGFIEELKKKYLGETQ